MAAEAARKQGNDSKPAINSLRDELPKLDRLIHEKARLGIISALAAERELSFRELKELLDTSDGNLSVHTRKLEEAGYVECEKGFEGRVPRSTYRLTKAGRKAFEHYLAHMETLVKAMRAPR